MNETKNESTVKTNWLYLVFAFLLALGIWAVADENQTALRDTTIKDIPVENIQKPQDDVMKADPVRNKIDVHDDVDDVFPFGDAPEIKVVAPPKKGFIKKIFGKK